MSDIAGVFHWPGMQPVSSNLLNSLRQGLSVPGDVTAGSWHDPLCGMVQIARPLTPQDFFDHQPLQHPDAGVTLVAAARLDYREELCERLGIAAARCETLPDSELILAAYLNWGEDCVRYLAGDFAFAIWNSRTRRLFCARDPRGDMPFFFVHEAQRRFAFATALPALLALPGVDTRLNLRMLADRLTFNGAHDCTQTFVEPIQLLPAAHCIRIDAQGVGQRRYWDAPPAQSLQLRSSDEYVDCFRERFTRAVTSRLRCARPVGAHLSGGLDSSSVSVLAAQALAQRNEPLQTFTQVPIPSYRHQLRAGASPDDRHLVTKIAQQQTNIVPHLVDIQSLTLEHELDTFFALSGMPPLNPFNRLWCERIQRQAARQQLGMMLTGSGGNFTVSCGVMAPHLDQLARSGRWARLWRDVRQAAAVQQVSALGLLAKQAQEWPLFSSLGLSNFQRGMRQREAVMMRPAFADQMQVDDRLTALDRSTAASTATFFEQLRRQRVLRAQNQSPLFWHTMARQYGVHCCDPTNDVRVVEFCLAVPYEQQFHQGWDRALIRHAMDPYLPKEVIWRQQRGKQSADWMLGFEQDLDLLRRDVDAMRHSPVAAEVLDLARMQALLQNWRGGAAVYSNSEEVYHSLLLRAWLVGRFILWFEQRTAAVAAAA
ncbi:MAG: hypothetical protein HPY82_07025 [Gammaproteobacteria bacterium]|nr:hypothetical protein [Gammaproteobacteria bacterium]